MANSGRRRSSTYATDIIFCNQGYKHVCGVDELRKTRSKQLEAAFESETDTHPLKARHKDSVAYTTQLESEYRFTSTNYIDTPRKH